MVMRNRSGQQSTREAATEAQATKNNNVGEARRNRKVFSRLTKSRDSRTRITRSSCSYFIEKEVIDGLLVCYFRQ